MHTSDLQCMAGKKKHKDDKVVVAEFRVSMNCNACERSVAKAVSKMKGRQHVLESRGRKFLWARLDHPLMDRGVKKFVTDMKNHRVVITGRINPQKVIKKLKRKTGKRVELVDEEDHDNSEGNKGDLGEQVMESWIVDCFDDSELHMMFNDENANACSIM